MYESFLDKLMCSDAGEYKSRKQEYSRREHRHSRSPPREEPAREQRRSPSPRRNTPPPPSSALPKDEEPSNASYGFGDDEVEEGISC